jgi:hypothetical protein
VKRAIATLEDAGLFLVPAACDSAPLRSGFKLVHRRQLEVRKNYEI